VSIFILTLHSGALKSAELGRAGPDSLIPAINQSINQSNKIDVFIMTAIGALRINPHRNRRPKISSTLLKKQIGC
jgi:hypothetical protein